MGEQIESSLQSLSAGPDFNLLAATIILELPETNRHTSFKDAHAKRLLLLV